MSQVFFVQLTIFKGFINVFQSVFRCPNAFFYGSEITQVVSYLFTDSCQCGSNTDNQYTMRDSVVGSKSEILH